MQGAITGGEQRDGAAGATAFGHLAKARIKKRFTICNIQALPIGGIDNDQTRCLQQRFATGEKVSLFNGNQAIEPGGNHVLPRSITSSRIVVVTDNSRNADAAVISATLRLVTCSAPYSVVVLGPAKKSEMLSQQARRTVTSDHRGLDQKSARSTHGVTQRLFAPGHFGPIRR